MLGLITNTLSLKETVSAVIFEKTKHMFYIFLKNFHSFNAFQWEFSLIIPMLWSTLNLH